MITNAISCQATCSWQEQVFAQVRKQVWYLRQPKLTLTTHLQHDLQLNSCERVQLGIRLEYSLKVEIPDTEIGQWQTLADVLSCVRRHLPTVAA